MKRFFITLFVAAAIYAISGAAVYSAVKDEETGVVPSSSPISGNGSPVVSSLSEGSRIIGDVSAEGQKTQSRRAVLSKVKAKKGEPIVDPAFLGDVNRLIETGFYDDVQVALEDMPGVYDAQGRPKVRVQFQVKERPLIRRIDFKGNQKLGDSKFREEISSKVDEPFDKIKAEGDAQRIVSKYHDEGYADAQVEYYTSLNPRKNKIILTFFITEGGRVLVDSVNVEGCKTFSEKKIRKVMKKTRRKKVFKEEDLRNDLEAVEKLYKNRGFLEVRLSPVSRVYNADHGRVSLSYSIDEGPRYTVGDFMFSGATLYTDMDLRKAVTLKTGRLYEQDRVDETLTKLHDLYADKGYLRAEIIPSTMTHLDTPAAGRVDFRFDITESSVVYVDRIYVEGNTYTKEYVVRREVLLNEGDVFSAGKVRRSVEKIYNLGFLDDVQVDVQQPRSPDRADLVFNVQEGKPGVLSAGAGFSSVDRFIGTVQVQHTNLFGRGQHANVLWEFGGRKQNYELGWTNPWFMGKPMSLGLNVFDTSRRLPFTSAVSGSNSLAYRYKRRGFSFRLGPRLSDNLSLIHDYTLERQKVFDIDSQFVNDPLLKPQNDLKSSFTNGVVYDTRDNVFDATRGARNSASVEWANGFLGGNVFFYKPEFSSAVYFPTFWKFVFSVSARGSYVQYIPPAKDVPLADKFTVGGIDTVRGYKLGNVGASPGSSMLILNAEYKFPIVQEKGKTILQGAFFADAGGSWDKLRQSNLSIGGRPRNMRTSVGFGIRFKTPVFPIRLDWGYALNRRDGEELTPLEFTIGSIF